MKFRVEVVEEEMKYILENMEVKIQFFGSSEVGLNSLPSSVIILKS